MNTPTSRTAAQRAVQLALEFLTRVWGPEHDLDAIDELVTEDYEITSGGVLISGRRAFREWVERFQEVLIDARTTSLDEFATGDGTTVVSRWLCTGRNNGIFGLPADGRPVAFTGIAIWRVRDGKLATCWVERAALEAVHSLTGR